MDGELFHSGRPSAPASTDIHFHTSGGRPAARYGTASTVFEEALDQGRWIGLYWSSGGQVQRENVSALLPGFDPLRYPVHTFELEINGQSLQNSWQWAGASTRPGQRPGTVEAVVELHHSLLPIVVRVVTRLDGSPILARYLEITNVGTSPAALAQVSPCTGVLWRTANDLRNVHMNANPSYNLTREPPFRLGYFAGDDTLIEGEFTWRPVVETLRIDRKRHGRTWGSPYYIIQNQLTGELFMLGLAWSAPFFAEFTHHPQRDLALLSFRMGPAGQAPQRVIAPGETVTTPEVHLGALHCSMDEASAAWHQHMRQSVIPPRPAGKEMYTIAGRVVEEPGEWILREIDIAASMGVEAFMVDAGWYGDDFSSWVNLRGDWNEGSWLPGGLAGIREYAHQKGLLFGLWHEAETAMPATHLAKDHPDWILRTIDGQTATEGLDLGHPESANFFEETVIRLIRDHQLDFYKLDYNISPGEGGQRLRDGFAENEAWRHYEVVYRTYERVLREFPQVCLENCASGGGRNDLGMMSRFHYASESDWSVLPYSIRAINSMSRFLPPETLCYYHNHINFREFQAHQYSDMDSHLRVTLFAVPVFVGFGGQDGGLESEFARKTRRYIALAKSFCRPIMANHPRVYHHTPDCGLFTPEEWCVLEYGAPDRSRGYAGVFRLAAGRGEYILRLRGVSYEARYRVRLDNEGQCWEAPGAELAQQGIHIGLDAPSTSELVLYEQV